MKLAKMQGVPPYVIYSDNTIYDICRKLPFTAEQLMQVSGLGTVKIEKYGKKIINEVKKYIKR